MFSPVVLGHRGCWFEALFGDVGREVRPLVAPVAALPSHRALALTCRGLGEVVGLGVSGGGSGWSGWIAAARAACPSIVYRFRVPYVPGR